MSTSISRRLLAIGCIIALAAPATAFASSSDHIDDTSCDGGEDIVESDELAQFPAPDDEDDEDEDDEDEDDDYGPYFEVTWDFPEDSEDEDEESEEDDDGYTTEFAATQDDLLVL